MSAEKKIPRPAGEDTPIYEIDPVESPAPTSAPSAQPAPAAPAAKDPLSEKPSLLEDFDEDADFSKDPEVEAAAAPRTAKRRFRFQEDVVPAPGETIVTPGRGSAKLWAGIAAVVLLAAVIFCAINSPTRQVVNSLLVIYNALVHAVTGVAALALSAVVLRLKLGPVDLAAARMLMCVSVFLLCANLDIRLIGTGSWEELACGALAYVGCMWFLFRFDQRRLATVAIVHFMLWILLYVGMALSAYAALPVTPVSPAK